MIPISRLDWPNSIRPQNRAAYVVNEETTKQCIVLPLLVRLGWDREQPQEVAPEYPVGAVESITA